MKSTRKYWIIKIVLANVLFVYALADMFYLKEATFDKKKKVQINCDALNSVKSDAGTWIWDGKVYNFYKQYKIVLQDSTLGNFCDAISSSPAIYIDNRRCNYWIDLNFGNETKTLNIKA